MGDPGLTVSVQDSSCAEEKMLCPMIKLWVYRAETLGLEGTDIHSSMIPLVESAREVWEGQKIH